MGIDREAQISLVAKQIQQTSKSVDIRSGGRRVIAAGDVVLRRRVAVAEKGRRQTRHRVVLVGNTIGGTKVSVGKVLCEPGKADFGCAISVL